MKSSIQLHLYISDSPCGDASIYTIQSRYMNKDALLSKQDSDHPNDNSVTTHDCIIHKDKSLNFTGAKIIDSSKNKHKFPIIREQVQTLSRLRLKSSRSNIPHHLRSTSLSCSDKLCRWVVLGLQGSSFLSSFIPQPVPLHGIVISKDPRTPPLHSETTSNNRDCLGHLNLNNTSITKDTKRLSPTDQLNALDRAIIKRCQTIARSMLPSNNTIENNTSEAHNINLDFAFHEKGISAINNINIVIPHISISDTVFSQGLASSQKKDIDDHLHHETQIDGRQSSDQKEFHQNTNEKKRKRHKLTRHSSPCGFSLNWHQPLLSIDKEDGEIKTFNGTKSFMTTNNNNNNNSTLFGSKNTKNIDQWMVEVTIGAKGLKQGKRPKVPLDVANVCSRLSRLSLLKLTLECHNILSKYGLKLLNLRDETSYDDNIVTINNTNNSSNNREDSTKITPNTYSLDNCIRHLQTGIISYQQGKEGMTSTKVRKIRDHVLRDMEEGPLIDWVMSAKEGDFYYHMMK